MQSSHLIFATFYNAGLRAYDIVVQSCDVFVDTDARIYMTDTNAGLDILQYDGK